MSASFIKPRRFQFTTLGILVATFWSAVFTVALVLFGQVRQHQLGSLPSESFAYLLVSLLLFVSLPAAIDGLFGRASRGMFVGIVLFVLFLLAINSWPLV